MVKHVLVAVAAAVAMAGPGTAYAQTCAGATCFAGTIANPCDSVQVGNLCHVCMLPDWSPVVPCFFEP